jgi:hypothetical protein
LGVGFPVPDSIEKRYNTIPIQNQTDLSSSNSGNKNPQSLIKTLINQNSISASEIPMVSPQSLSPELLKNGEMPLQAKFTDSRTSSPLNINIPSTPILDAGINKTSISSSENPVVSPQSLSPELVTIEEIPLVKEYVSISDEPLPIIQAKFSNSSLSASSVPVVNNLSTPVFPEQIQQNNHSEDLVSSKQENLTSQVSSISLPIVTAQPLTSKFNSSNEEISFSITSPHSQNQPLSIVKAQPVNISNSRIHQNNHHQNISPLPVVSVTSIINPHLNPQSSPFPLAKTASSSQNISYQPNHNNIISNQNSLSSPAKTFASSLSATETSISPTTNQSNIDVDSIATQVERKLMRRLVIESERRGKIR